MAAPCRVVSGGNEHALTARLHNRTFLSGADPQGQDRYADMAQLGTFIVFDEADLADAGLVLAANDVVVFPDFIAEGTDLAFLLQYDLPPDGPVNVTWAAAPRSELSSGVFDATLLAVVEFVSA